MPLLQLTPQVAVFVPSQNDDQDIQHRNEQQERRMREAEAAQLIDDEQTKLGCERFRQKRY